MKKFPYEHFELWDSENWKERLSHISPLAECLGSINLLNGAGYCRPEWDKAEEKAHYHNKTGSIDDPRVFERLKEKGLTAAILDLTMHWIAVVPEKLAGQRLKKIPGLIIFLQADYEDYYWAMETLTQYDSYLDAAASEEYILLFAVSNNGPDTTRTYVNMVQEACTLFPLDPQKLYVDVAMLAARNMPLSSVAGLRLTPVDPTAETDPDKAVVPIWNAKISALPVSGSWEDRGSLGRDLVMSDKYSLASFDRESFRRSQSGRRMMDGIVLEYLYDSVEDPGLKRWMRDKGIRFDIHVSKGERWLTLSPEKIKEGKKLPLFCVMQEVYYGNEHQAVTALGYFEEMAELTAKGEFITLFFVMEDPDANDQLAELIDEAAEILPVDKERVYVTGHSHDGRFALEFSVRNWKKIAAVATLGNFMGLEDPKVLGDPRQSVSDEKIEKIKTFDLPCANFCGCMEHGGKLPVNVDARTLPLRPGQQFGRTITLEDRVSSWQRRCNAWNCRVPSLQEMTACADSTDKVEQELGFPVDSSEIRMLDGWEHYIGDIRNRSGKYHLRMVAIENCPHVPSPSMLDLAWEFCRQFARNNDGSIRELDNEIK